jgi:ribosomal protein L17
MNKNRQVNRTKKLIENEMIKLLKKKDINQITVKEICDMCDINRGTFYNHYLDIYDLMNKMENDLVSELESSLSKNSSKQLDKNLFPLFKEILDFINQRADIVSILLKENENSLFIDKIINLSKTGTIQSWSSIYKNINNKSYNYFVEYSIYGCLGIIKKWFNKGRKESPDELALLLENIVISGANFLKMK